MIFFAEGRVFCVFSQKPKTTARNPRPLILPVLSPVRSARSVFTPLKGGALNNGVHLVVHSEQPANPLKPWPVHLVHGP